MTATLPMIDAEGAYSQNIPANAPKVAGYVTGSGGVPWTAADWARFPGVKITIDQSPSGLEFAAGKAEVLDVETGAATLQDAVTSIPERQKRGQYSTIYVNEGNLQSLKDALSAAHITMNKVGFWIADWSLSEAEAASRLGNEIVAIQYASPTSNPHTLVPGSGRTLTEANADLSITMRSWYPPADPAPAWQATALRYANAIKAGATELADLLERHQ